MSRQSQPRAHVSGSRGLVEKRLRSPRVIPRSLKRQTTCAILRIRHVGHTREPREPDEGRVDARGRHEPKGSKWGETRRLLDTCAMSKRGQMLVSTREPRVEALSQVGHLSEPPNSSANRLELGQFQSPPTTRSRPLGCFQNLPSKAKNSPLSPLIGKNANRGNHFMSTCQSAQLIRSPISFKMRSKCAF